MQRTLRLVAAGWVTLWSFASGCALPVRYDDQLQALVGGSATELRHWMGTPSEVVAGGNVEFRLYRWIVPNVEILTERRNTTFASGADQTEVNAICQMAFGVREDRVTAVAASGKTTLNGVVDGLCARMFLTCLTGLEDGRCPFAEANADQLIRPESR